MLIATITTQRSGSKLLASCFNSGLETRSLGEVFNPDSWQYAGNFHQFVRALGTRVVGRSNEEILDEYFDGIKQVISRIVHLDVMYNQMEIPCLSWNPYDVPFILGYLKSRGSIIISLERDTLETYASSKYLELGSPAAHVFNVESKQDTIGGLQLDAAEYDRYRKSILRQRASLREGLGDYPNFFACSYDEIARLRKLPDALCEMIQRVAAEQLVRVNDHLLQVVSPRIYKSGVDYAKAFMNFEELKKLDASYGLLPAANDRQRSAERRSARMGTRKTRKGRI